MIFPVVRELAGDGVPVATTCRVLKLSTSGFYDWERRGPSGRDVEQAHLMNLIYDAHKPPTAPTGHAGCTPSWSSASTSRSATVGWSA